MSEIVCLIMAGGPGALLVPGVSRAAKNCVQRVAPKSSRERQETLTADHPASNAMNHERRPIPPSLPSRLSFVIPVYNEELNIEPLARRIETTCDGLNIANYEVLFIENGSWDRSEQIIRSLHARNPRMKMVQLSRNFKYQGAITSGLSFARGEWVAILDGDQQDPPELIADMLRKAQEGYDVVYGMRAKRKETLFRRIAFFAFYRIWRWVSNIDVPLDAGEFCIMHRRVVDVLVRMPERLRFMRGLRAWAGFRQTGIPYHRMTRAEGESKFNLISAFGLAFDGLFAFSYLPIRAMMLIGLGLVALSMLVGVVNVTFWVLSTLGIHLQIGIKELPPGLTQVYVVFAILFGFVILCLGVIGEYVGRIYEEVKRRPIYVVRNLLLDSHTVPAQSPADAGDEFESRLGGA